MQDTSVARRVAIVGADGFIGRHLAGRCAAMPALELILIGRRFVDDVLARRCPKARLVQADMISPEAAAACAGADAVIDLAASESPQSLAGRGEDEIAAIAALHCEFYERLGRGAVRHVIMLSSGGTVYGPTTARWIAEDHPTRPRGGYGVAKLMVEQGLEEAARRGGFGQTILRAANCYGPGQAVKRRQGLIAAILRCNQSGQPLKIAGDGTIVRDYVHVEDVVDALVAAIDGAPGAGERINIGSGRGTSILELIDLFAAIAGRRLAVEFGPANDFDVPHNVLDIAK
ncbi:MAG TPA: NAD-dependent epimerase/dehydratase family protein, partial [Dongiaceae bacterium]|nr:NAD-dependent epimerase/dehydratase family protein [Dongiaceae bacterium]